MKPSENMPSFDTSMRGVSLDHSIEMYRVYLEVAAYQGMARNVIEEYVGPERSKDLTELPFGYECELSIQCVPDIVRALAKQNIGVYQVVRYAKTNNMWK